MDHLLQHCEWVQQIWEKGGMVFGKAQLGESHIKDTIELWEGKYYKNAIVNKIW